MKISVRILLINFVVVVAILTISAAAYYSVMYNIVSSQQSRYVVNSANNFLFSYRGLLEDTEDEFQFLEKNNFPAISPQDQNNIDFILAGGNDPNLPLEVLFSGEGVFVPSRKISMQEFLANNPYAVVKSYSSGGKNYYYGRIFNEKVLNILSQRIGSELALIWNNSAAEISNSYTNEKYSKVIEHAYLSLMKAGGSTTYSEISGDDDIIAARFNPGAESELNKKFQFIIFTRVDESSSVKSALTDILQLIAFTGIVLSLILTMIFTHKIRKQITDLNNATEELKSGDLTKRIKIKSKDELGQLGNAFNTMLDVLSKNELIKNQYSEFIALINQNPTISELSEAALENIVKTCGFSAGALYIAEDLNFKKTASHGIQNETAVFSSELFNTVARTGEPVELKADVSSGYSNPNIKEILITPVIFNNKVIALIELGSVVDPGSSAKEYLTRIQKQLAIGITNALAFRQLEKVVAELKELNEEYQKQNIQVKKQNETLLELHKELKEKAEELAFQKEKAEESTQLKSQFLASMSHELRTPMNSILGLTELILEESSIAGKNRERLQVVLKSGRRLMNLINDILDFSKIEAGKSDVHEEEVLLEEIISEVETSVSPLVKQKKIGFNVERNLDTDVMIITDRGKLIQVFINLLGNAVKFTEKGSVDFIISAPSDQELRFDIKDTGIGISDKDKEIIFQEFRQADGSTTRKYDGTGLGLAISSRICSMLKGRLSLQSILGEGSTFTLIIPFRKGRQVLKPGSLFFNVETLVKNRKNPVLVIDDDEEARFNIGQYLDSRGYDVVFADKGSKGIAEAERIQPFAVILDLMLPNKEGWTTLKELKENPLTKDIPVILISILADKKAGYGLGAFEYFIKPIPQGELLSAFSKLENLARKRIEKIVVVDDDELEFEKFAREFKNENIRIDYIKESEFAFSKVREIQPDLVIIDLLMPKIDGITLSHRLKSNKETRHIPIIISTAKDISDLEKDELQDIVENITIKGKGHPLDVLKVVRDRIRMQEMYAAPDHKFNENAESDNESAGAERIGLPLLDVLIVDDDPDALYTLDEIVQSCDCSTTLAKGGAECLAILEHKTPDLILLDIMMPVMDGFQTLKKIRENKGWENIPVYAVTAKAMLEDKNIILKYGFDDYIFKPVSAGILAFKLKRLLFKLRVNQ